MPNGLLGASYKRIPNTEAQNSAVGGQSGYELCLLMSAQWGSPIATVSARIRFITQHMIRISQGER